MLVWLTSSMMPMVSSVRRVSARSSVGEASFTPASHSLLTDVFPPNRRATALAIFAAGAAAGNIVGFFGGGLLGVALGWRNTFILVGLAGIPAAVLFRLLVREPRRSVPARRSGGDSADSIAGVWRYLFSKPSFVHPRPSDLPV